MYLYARLKPYSPRTGHLVQRLHYRGTLFSGGPRPTWYRVSVDDARDLQAQKQDSGADMFDVVDEATKLQVDQIEQHRQLAAMGIAAAEVAAPMQRAPIDLTGGAPPAPPPPLVAAPAPAAPMPVMPMAIPPTPSAPFMPTQADVAPGRSAAIPPAMPAASPGFAPMPVAATPPAPTGGDLSTSDFKSDKDKA